MISLALWVVASPAALDRSSVAFESALPNVERIVVGKVRAIEAQGMAQVAVLDVERTLKGERTKQIRFLVSPTWPCDESGGEKGERLVLLVNRAPKLTGMLKLTPAQAADLYLIDNDGAGRLPVEKGRIQVNEFEGRVYRSYYEFPARFPHRVKAKGIATISEQDVVAFIQKAVAAAQKDSLQRNSEGR